jgi:hypothetical protein
VAQYKAGRYPGLLNRSDVTTVETRLENMYDHVMAHKDATEGELAAVVAEYVAAVDREQTGADAGGNTMVGKAVENEEAKQLSAQLMEGYRRCRAYVTTGVGALDERLVQGSDQLKQRCINEAAYARLEQRTKKDAPDKALEMLRELTKQVTERAYEICQRSGVESEAMLKMRKAKKQLLETPGMPHLIPAQDLVNGKVFDTYIAWLEVMIAQPFKVAMRNMQTAIVLYHAIKTALILPEFQSGEPLLNISIEGENSSGKSFLLWLMIAIHLDGACISTNHISPHAFTTGANNSNQAIMQNEAPSDQFMDPFDKSGNGRGGDAGVDVRFGSSHDLMLSRIAQEGRHHEVDAHRVHRRVNRASDEQRYRRTLQTKHCL